jgi:hypothetical protein
LTSGLHALDRRVQHPAPVSARSPSPDGARVRLRESSTGSRGDTRVARPVLPLVPGRRPRSWQLLSATWVRIDERGASGFSCPASLKRTWDALLPWASGLAPHGASPPEHLERSGAVPACRHEAPEIGGMGIGLSQPTAQRVPARAAVFVAQSPSGASRNLSHNRSKLANANTVAIRRGRASANSAGPSAETLLRRQ